MSGDDIDLGTCCLCGGSENVRNVIALDLRAPASSEPGGTWGCFQCGRPNEGAIAVLCDACLERHREGEPLQFAVQGPPAQNERVPLATLTEKFEHDMSKHPEVALYEKWRQELEEDKWPWPLEDME